MTSFAFLLHRHPIKENFLVSDYNTVTIYPIIFYVSLFAVIGRIGESETQKGDEERSWVDK